MHLTRKVSIVLFLGSFFLFSLSILFNPSITGYAVYQDLDKVYPFNFMVLVFFMTTLLAFVGMYYGKRIEDNIEDELINYDLIEPNLSLNNLKDYIEYSVGEGRRLKEIKTNLMEVGWDENLVQEVYDELYKYE